MNPIKSNNIFAFLTTNNERATIARGSVGSFLIQIGFAGLSFITTTVLVRLLGSEGYGAYSNAMAWVNILTVFGLFGFNTLLFRDLAILQVQKKWALIKGLLQFSDGLILFISVSLALILLGVAGYSFSMPEKETMRFSLWVAAPLIPLYSIINLRQSAMRGFQQVTLAMLPDYMIRPGLVLVSFLGFYLLFPNLINVQSILVISIVAAMVALIISVHWLRTFLPDGYGMIEPQFQRIKWLRSAPVMVVIGGMQILIAQLPVIILGMLSDAKNVSYFSVASRVANLLIFLPMAVGIVMAPIIASLYSQGERLRLQNVLKKTNRLTFVVTFLFGLVFFIFAKNILSIFGVEFQVAQNALILLGIGYLVDTGFGISIITLMMTGYERVVAGYQTVFVVLLVVLSVILIPFHGGESAALAFMSVMIVSRFIFSFLARQKTGIDTTIF